MNEFIGRLIAVALLSFPLSDCASSAPEADGDAGLELAVDALAIVTRASVVFLLPGAAP